MQIKTLCVKRYLRERSRVDEQTGCIEWQGSLFAKTGYGQANLFGKSWAAHRMAYQAYKGPIPKGKLVCHRCNNRLCLNPEHLYAGTHLTNKADSVAAGTHQHKNRKITYRTLQPLDIFNVRYLSKLTRQKLAQFYHVSVSQIAYIQNGKSQKHLTFEKLGVR